MKSCEKSVSMRCCKVVAILVLLANESEACDVQPKVHKDSGIYSLGGYHPPVPKEWASIPEPVRSQITTHLKNRLGDAFYAKLSLVGGQVIDFKALRDKDPNSRNYRWEVPAYVLHLRFSLPELGIEYYDAQIECRSDGSVMKEIDLPEIAKHPERAQFVSTSKAFGIARQEGFDLAKTEAELDYRVDPGVCVFSFRQLTSHDGPLLSYKCLDIDAHNGKIIKVYTVEAIE